MILKSINKIIFIKKIRNQTYHLLRWTEKWTKTDMVYLTKGGFWLSSEQVVSSVTSFLLAIAFANLFPKEDYGTYKYILSIAGILSIFTLRGMGSALTQAVARGYEKTTIKSLKVKIKWGLVGTLGGLCVSIYYFIMGSNTLGWSFLITALFIPIFDTYCIWRNYLQGKKLFKKISIFSIIGKSINLIILLTTLWLTNSIIIVIFVYFTSWSIIRFITYQSILKQNPPNDKMEEKTIVYGKHASFINITATLLNSLDNIITFQFIGPAGLAIYAFAQSPVMQLRALFDKIPSLAIPKMANKTAKELTPQLIKRTILLTIIGIIIAAIYSLFAYYIYAIFFPQYLDAVIYSQVFSISIILSFSKIILSSSLSAKLTLTPKWMLYLWNIPSIILIISLLILIGQYGIMGVVISRLISLFASVLVGVYIWIHILKKERQQMLP